MSRFYAWMTANWAWTRDTTGQSMLAQLRSVTSRIRAALSTSRARVGEHIAVVFATTFAVDAAGNAKHVFEAHGLDGLKAAGYAIAAAALAAAYHTVKPRLQSWFASFGAQKRAS